MTARGDLCHLFRSASSVSEAIACSQQPGDGIRPRQARCSTALELREVETFTTKVCKDQWCKLIRRRLGSRILVLNLLWMVILSFPVFLSMEPTSDRSTLNSTLKR